MFKQAVLAVFLCFMAMGLNAVANQSKNRQPSWRSAQNVTKGSTTRINRTATPTGADIPFAAPSLPTLAPLRPTWPLRVNTATAVSAGSAAKPVLMETWGNDDE